MAFPIGWQRSCPIVIPRGQVKASSLAHFPVLLTAACLPTEMVTSGGTNAAQANGGDIRFSLDAAGQTQLACEIAVWTQNAVPANAAAEIWVGVPTLYGDFDNTIYVWYKPTMTQSQPAANAAYGSQAVWSAASFGGVWHLGDVPSTAVDSTGINNASSISATAGTGKIDGAATFNGSSQSITVPTDASLEPAAFTLSAWVKPSVAGGSQSSDAHFVVKDARGGAPFIAYDLNINSGGTGKFAVEFGTGTTTNYVQGTTVPSAATWYHVVGVYDGVTLRIYVNGGIENAASASGALNYTHSSFTIGGAPSVSNWYAGIVDEARLASVARDAGWISTEYANQSSPSTFAVVGTPYAPGAYASPGGFYGGRG